MVRLLRTALGLFAITIGCISLVIAVSRSSIEWGCLRLTPTDWDLDRTVDVQRGIVFTENATIPQKYIPAVLWAPMNDDSKVYYKIFTPAGNQRDGIIDSARSYGYINGGSNFNFTESIYSISPDLKYLAYKSVNHTSQDQAMILRNATTFAPVVSVKVSGNLNTPDIVGYRITNDYPKDWSSTYEWLAFTTFNEQSATLTLISSRTGETQSLAIASGMPFRKIIWSPAGMSLAVLGGGFTTDASIDMLYRKLDLVALKDGQWQVIHSYDTGIPDQEYQMGGLEDAVWSGLGNAFSILRLNKDATYTVLTFHLHDTVTETTLLLPSTDRPSFIFSGEWICQRTVSGTRFNLIAIAETQPTITVASECFFLKPAPDNTTWLIRQIPPASLEGHWLVIRTSPFSLSPFNLPAQADRILAWSPDSQKAFFWLPYNPYFSDGQLGIVDMITGRWTLLPDKVAMTSITISPDSSRYTIWGADRNHLLLVDIENHVIATIPNNFARSNDYVPLQWSPDSSRFVVMDTDGSQVFFSVISRNGEHLRVITLPTQSGAFGLPQAWTHCEPSPKLPRLNLPQ
ncbi:MAG: hypothetical protein KF716_00505 [Anaerolineae bacterium]|nr:hypothetical protein [Anaerolineae bacterium]